MEARAVMEEVRGILDDTPSGSNEQTEARRDPGDVAFEMIRDHGKLKNIINMHVDTAMMAWMRAEKQVRGAKRYGGQQILAIDLLQSNQEPVRALEKLREEIVRIIGAVRRTAAEGRHKSSMETGPIRGPRYGGHLEGVDGYEGVDGVDLLDEMYSDIGKDAPYVGSDNGAAGRNLGNNAPQVVATAKMRVPEKAIQIVKKGVEKSKAAGSQDLNVVGTGKDFVLVSGDPARLKMFARQVAARSASPTVVSTAFGGGGLMATEDSGYDVEFPADVFDDLTEGDVLRAVLYEATYYQDGKDTYVDTAFMNALGKKMKGCTMSHMGFGEFTLKCGKDGEVEFDRMRGKDFPGQSGRSHKVYDNKKGALVKKMMAAMKGTAKASKAESREGYETELAKLDEALQVAEADVDDAGLVERLRNGLSQTNQTKLDEMSVEEQLAMARKFVG